MNQTLEQLIKLQKIDQRLLEIKNFMGDLPSMVETQEKDVATMRLYNEEKQSRITQIEKEMRHCEREIEGMNMQMAKYKEHRWILNYIPIIVKGHRYENLFKYDIISLNIDF